MYLIEYYLLFKSNNKQISHEWSVKMKGSLR